MWVGLGYIRGQGKLICLLCLYYYMYDSGFSVYRMVLLTVGFSSTLCVGVQVF